MSQDRREVISALAAVTAASALPQETCADTPAPQIPLEPIGRLPELVTPGKPGDFDFLAGEWRISNWRQKSPGEWDVFDGEATVHPILGGVGSVEELRIPARDFSGMGLRLLDAERKIWADHWVNSRSGVVSTPGQEGRFEGGAGIFISEETVNGTVMKYLGLWDAITSDTCRWRQASSADGGETWDQSWIMHWRRVTS